MSRARVAVALICMVAAALMPAAGVVMDLATNPDWYRPRDDRISAFERRYAPLREELRGTTLVGYLAPGSKASESRTVHLYTTRYALAPVQVLNSIDQPLVVADVVADPRSLPPGLTVRRKYGGGLMLLERASR